MWPCFPCLRTRNVKSCVVWRKADRGRRLGVCLYGNHNPSSSPGVCVALLEFRLKDNLYNAKAQAFWMRKHTSISAFLFNFYNLQWFTQSTTDGSSDWDLYMKWCFWFSVWYTRTLCVLGIRVFYWKWYGGWMFWKILPNTLKDWNQNANNCGLLTSGLSCYIQ